MDDVKFKTAEKTFEKLDNMVNDTCKSVDSLLICRILLLIAYILLYKGE